MFNKLIYNKEDHINLEANPTYQRWKEKHKNLSPYIKQLIKLLLDIPDRDKSADLINKCFDSVTKQDIKMQIEYLEETSDFYPNNKFIWSLLESGYELDNNLIGQAKCLERLVAIDPNDVDAWRKLGGLYGFKLFNFERAIFCTKKVIEISNDNILMKPLSHLYELNVDMENAIKYAKLYLEKFPNDIEEKERLKNLLNGISPLSEIRQRIKTEKK